MRSLPRRGSRVALLASIATLFAFVQPFRLGSAVSAERATQPNIVLILTDDQRFDTLWAMPTVQSELVDQGVTFSNAFVVNSLCCPSRASILTGQYSHSTDVYHIQPPHGGFSSFQDVSTTATWLHDAGYRTGLFGKYLDGYDKPDSSYVPPGWDRWLAFTSNTGNGDYFDYTMSDDGHGVSYGHAEADYSTDVLASEAESFIRSSSQDEPFFVYLAPKAPHDPATPAPRHVGAFSNLDPYRPPSYNEDDVSDKPEYIRSTPQLSIDEQAGEDQFRKDQYETLLAVDEAVGGVLDALTETGRLSNTMIVFTSDNGIQWGEHRRIHKMLPYEESIRVPMVVRFDPLTSTPKTDSHLVANIDLAPSFAEIAGVTAPGAEGMSLVPLLGPTPPPWREDFLVEHLQAWDDIPTYCALRTASFDYVSYATVEEELYDLASDPYELQDLADDPAYGSTLADLRDRAWSLCVPPPPDLCTVMGTDGDDVLVGTVGADVVCGLGGDDVLQGMGGNDVLVGGDGMDTASFSSSAHGVTVDLAIGTASGDGSDVLTGIENITGSKFADTLKGDASPNAIYGRGGADIFDKSGGDDTLYGGDGNDLINGGYGKDALFGGTGDDDLFGDPGDDVLSGNKGNDDLNGGKGIDSCAQGPGTGTLTSCES